MRRVAIIGLGLMGGSLGLALKSVDKGWHVTGYTDNPEDLKDAVSLGVCDRGADDPASAVEDADLCIFCTPVKSIIPLIRECQHNIKPGAVITDVGSTKAYLMKEAMSLFNEAGVIFIGSHPVTGSENFGLRAARKTLYEKATVAVTPMQPVSESALATVCEMWQSVGSIPIVIDADKHDAILAATSHLPHFAAFALSQAVLVDQENTEGVRQLIGPGFLDTTRIADSLPVIWRDIAETNAAHIIRALDVYITELNGIKEYLQQDNFEQLQDYMEATVKVRRAINEIKK